MSDYPESLKYSKEHEWCRIDGDKAQIGITSFAVEQLGDVTQLDLPAVGDELTKDEVFGTVESVKAVSDLFAPVSGTVVRVNSALDDAPEMINDSTYDNGWIVEVLMSDAGDAEALMARSDYLAFIEKQD